MNQPLSIQFFHTSLGSTGNNKENQPKPIILLHFLHRYIFKIIQIEVIMQLADLNMALGLNLSLVVT